MMIITLNGAEALTILSVFLTSPLAVRDSGQALRNAISAAYSTAVFIPMNADLGF